MRFESAAFKLSHEMTQLLDPSGQRDSSQFHLFEELCVRGFLAVSLAICLPVLSPFSTPANAYRTVMLCLSLSRLEYRTMWYLPLRYRNAKYRHRIGQTHFPTSKPTDVMTESWSALSICMFALPAYAELLQLESRMRNAIAAVCRHAVWQRELWPQLR